MNRASSIAAEGAVIFAGALVLCVPAILNGFPFLFFDTMHYFAAGAKIAGLLGEILHRHAETAPQAPPIAAAAPAAEDRHTLLAYIGARSPYYSAAFYLLNQVWAGWGAAAAQALAGAWLLRTFTRVFTLSRRAYLLIIAGLAGVSSLPWIATLLMPDVFGGYGALAAALLIFCWSRLGGAARAGCFALLLAALSFHLVNMLLIAAAIPIAALLLRRTRADPRAIRRGVGVLAGACAAALLAGALYPIASQAVLHRPVKTPPLLTARLLADGPGRDVLRTACAAGASYALCAFAGRPLTQSDDILWSQDPARGVYMTAPEPMQDRLIAEQPRFVLDVLTHRPLQQLGVSLRNWALQFFTFGLGDLSFDPKGWQAAAAAGAVDESLQPWLRSPANLGRFPLGLLTLLTQVCATAAALFLAYRLPRADITGEADGQVFISICWFALALLIVNAAVAGMLSGVYARYQARVIWIAPLLALVAAFRFGWRAREIKDAAAVTQAPVRPWARRHV